ncbi:hypothetical protein SeMB42_g00312 [Synchytrium endobioticum]|uniref:Piwi domain-containing protein n=1 Tax=Synchytrium endobioticum TaxID=286115 RepID=A0A507DBS2_9FUNG|nr:hypothetical protein SeLEV6574_g01848 [Synchytrium endobioticum]TPX54359.1 hypothetical protein SeMB42_g00312 [Synchytrium endobioticum]
MSQLLSVRAPEHQLAPGPPGPASLSSIQRRPGLGNKGRRIALYSNFFQMRFPQKTYFQYDIEITPVAPRPTKRGVFEAFKQQWSTQFEGSNAQVIRRLIYDGEKQMFSYVKLPIAQGRKTEFTVNASEPDDDRMKSWTVRIQFATDIDMSLLNAFLNWNGEGKQPDTPRACFQALEVLMRHVPSLLLNPVGRNSYFLNDDLGRSVKGGLCVALGWFQSVRAGYKGLLINLDASATAFYEVDTVDHVVAHFFDRPEIMPTWRQLNANQIREVTRFLRTVKVTTTYATQAGIRATYRIVGIDDVPAGARQIPQDDQTAAGAPPETVAQYYHRSYNITLRYPEVPCIVTGTKRKRYFPMELIKIKPGQRHIGQLKPEQLAEMIKVTSTNPKDRFDRITNGQKQLHKSEVTQFVDDWGVQINNRLLQVPGRILDPPTLAIGGRTIQPREGGWASQRFAVPSNTPLLAWSLVIIDYALRDHERRAIENFRRVLVDQLSSKGMQVPNKTPPIVNGTRMGVHVRSLLLEAGKAAMNGSGKKRPDIIICIIPKKNHPSYPEIKRIAETDLGVVTQCIALPNLLKDRGLDKYTDNVTLKINAKMGGINTHLDQRSDLPEFLTRSPSMLMGADVSHPPGGGSGPSIASVVGTMDRRFSFYNSVIKCQGSRVEGISDLTASVMELLQNFQESSKVFPQRVVFFRDGVSEGQLFEVMTSEVRAFKQACERLNVSHDVKLTFIVVTKRHHARMFPVNPNDGDRKNNNCLPGTTVDTNITHPFAHDYYQYGSQGLLGTSRPAHYHILYDENGFDANMIQDMTFKLSHLYARCNRSVSLAAPAQYAHLVAGRAKYYQEFSDAATTATGSSGGAAVAMRTVVPSVRKSMYFV